MVLVLLSHFRQLIIPELLKHGTFRQLEHPQSFGGYFDPVGTGNSRNPKQAS